MKSTDIAVKDSRNPGRYVLGIECDGATYHSSRSARDRDRLRQEVLEGLGWRLHRIWSTSWYQNQELELERLLVSIQNAEDSFGAQINMPPKSSVPIDQMEPFVRDEETQQDKSQQQLHTNLYQKAVIAILLGDMELHELPPQTLLPHILDVVAVESPIHKTELIRRITEAANLKRSGSRIQDAVNKAILYGTQENSLQLKDGFLWHPDMHAPEVRDRSLLENSARKFTLIAPEEIKAAIHQAVESAFSLSTEDVSSCAARAMGFQRVTSQAKALFDTNLWEMINGEVLEQLSGMVSLRRKEK